MPETTELEILDPDECRRLLQQAPIGRVVFTEKALPAAQPVTFLVHENAVIIRTTAGSRLANAAQNAILAFEVDDIDAENQTGWNVTVIGPAEIVDDPDELATLARLPLRAWAPSERDVFVRVRIDLSQGGRTTGS